MRARLSTAHCAVLAAFAVLALFAPVEAAGATDLLQFYARALEFDPQLQTARYDVEIAEASILQSRSGTRPNVSATALTSRVNQNIRNSDSPLFSEGRSEFSNVDYSLSLTQPVYHSEVRPALQGSRTRVRQATFQFAAAEQELIFRLAEAVFNYLAARDDLEFTTAEQSAIQRQLAQSESRLVSGLGTITAVHEARARFALALAAEVDARDGLEAARQAIAEITGEVPPEVKRLSEAFPLVGPERIDVEAWVETGLFQNPTLKALEAQLQAIEYELQRQKNAARLPALDLVTTLSDADSGGTEFGGGREVRSSNIALRLSVPIFDGGQATAALRTASAQYQQVIQRVELTRRQVERSTRDAFQRVISGVTRVDALRQTVFSQESVVSEKEESLRSGLTTGLDVLDARRDLFSALRDLARARYVFILNGLRLKQSAGVLSAEDLRQINAFMQ